MIVLGLGNPGAQYEHTRHNAGFDALELAAAFFQKSLKKRCFCLYRYCSVEKNLLVEPLTFMNNSGKVIKHFKKRLSAGEQIAVIADNMDLACGGVRIRKGGGTGGQKGLNSIAEALGTNDFIRIYVGTGRPHEGTSVIDHVLGRESKEPYLSEYREGLKSAARAVEMLIHGASVEVIQGECTRKGIL